MVCCRGRQRLQVEEDVMTCSSNVKCDGGSVSSSKRAMTHMHICEEETCLYGVEGAWRLT